MSKSQAAYLAFKIKEMEEKRQETLSLICTHLLSDIVSLISTWLPATLDELYVATLYSPSIPVPDEHVLLRRWLGLDSKEMQPYLQDGKMKVQCMMCGCKTKSIVDTKRGGVFVCIGCYGQSDQLVTYCLECNCVLNRLTGESMPNCRNTMNSHNFVTYLAL